MVKFTHLPTRLPAGSWESVLNTHQQMPETMFNEEHLFVIPPLGRAGSSSVVEPVPLSG
jgi:hypothetical protein